MPEQKNNTMNLMRPPVLLMFGVILSVTTGCLILIPTQAAAASGAAPPIRIVTKTLTAAGANVPQQQSKPMTVTTATLTARGAAPAAPSKPIQVKTATLVANGKRNR